MRWIKNVCTVLSIEETDVSSYAGCTLVLPLHICMHADACEHQAAVVLRKIYYIAEALRRAHANRISAVSTNLTWIARRWTCCCKSAQKMACILQCRVRTYQYT